MQGPARADVQLRLRGVTGSWSRPGGRARRQPHGARPRTAPTAPQAPRRAIDERRCAGAGDDSSRSALPRCRWCPAATSPRTSAQAAPLIARGRRRGRRARAAARVLRHSRRARDRQGAPSRERDGDGPQQDFLARAGAAASRDRRSAAACRSPAAIRRACAARCLVYGPDGARVARYDKIHLFALRARRRALRRGAHDRAPATAPVAFDAPCGRVGPVDLLRPALSRALPRAGRLALIVVPSAFTRDDRQRALAPAAARARRREPGLRARGRAGRRAPRWPAHLWALVLVDPWGEIVAERVDDGPGVIVATVDPARTADVRTRLPAHRHRVM